MDQVRATLKVLWEQRFWVLCVIALLVASGVWSLATTDLQRQFAQRKSAIERQFTAIKKLNSQRLHPNEQVIEENRQQLVQESQITLQIWQDLYESQTREVLYWPQDQLRAEFIAEINKLRFGDPFPPKLSRMRDNYWNYIQKRFGSLLKIVAALPLSEERGRTAGGEYGGFRDGRGTSDADDQDYLVQWLDQGKVRDQLDFKTNPKALEIWVTQEDLWVYENLLNVIAHTNRARGATRPDNAAIRVIVSLEVGRAAVVGGDDQGNIVPPATGEGASGRGGAAGRGRERTSRAGGGRDSGTKILESRYLDLTTGEPLPAGDAANFRTEFRQLPIRMLLIVEQTWIPQLLVACANAALPIEVKQLRINPQQSGAGYATQSSAGNAPRNLESEGDTTALAELEIQGVVFIYNRPDQEMLRLADQQQASQLAGN